MRLTPLLLVLASAAGALSACGSASAPPHTTRSTASARTTAKSAPLSKAWALAAAHAVNLTAADVPGFSVATAKQGETAQEKRYERELLSCVGPLGSSSKLASASSKEFELNHGILELGVSSEVGVAPTPATAASELAAIRSTHVRACFAHYFDLVLRRHRYAGGTIGPVSVASGTPPAAGTTGGFGWRVTATLVIRGIRIPFYLDILGFVYGPATVTMFSTGAVQPFPAAAQQRLFALLLSRAKVHIP
jgi:hypothetical protein